ncbi:MAG TPA: hypothetical protein VHZ98_10385 [Galbitalea sp.]|nr:hypothetical protein [Galbitalea sp.]
MNEHENAHPYANKRQISRDRPSLDPGRDADHAAQVAAIIARWEEGGDGSPVEDEP